MPRTSLYLLVAWAWLGAAASASGAVPEAQNFSGERFRWATDGNGIIDVEGAAVVPHLQWDVGLWVGWAHDPLVLARGSTTVGALLQERVGAGLVGAVGLLDWLQVGLELPFVLYQYRPTAQPAALSEPLAALQAGGVGDLRLVPKVQLLHADSQGIDLGVVLGFSLPSGRSADYLGEPGVTFQPEVALGQSWMGLHGLVNLGVTLRNGAVVINQQVGSEATYRLGAAYRFADVGLLPLRLAVVASGSFALQEAFARSNQRSLELRGEAAYQVQSRWQAYVSGGGGVLHGWSTPAWRVVVGARFSMAPEAAAPDVAAPEAPPVNTNEVLDTCIDSAGAPDAAEP